MSDNKPKYNPEPLVRIPKTTVLSVKESGSFSHGGTAQDAPKESKDK